MFEDRDALAASPAHDVALDCVECAVRRCLPDRVVRDAVSVDGTRLTVGGERYDLADYETVLVLGFGKGAGRMAAALEAVLGDHLDDGAVVTNNPAPTDVVAVHEGRHPTPAAENVAGARRLLELADRAGPDDLVLVPLTGGGSALLTCPADGVTLEDVRAVTTAGLESGMAVDELNVLRKHLSRTKGGLLARRLAPATVVGVVLSDFVGDDPSVIASGPISPDPSTFADARAVVERHDLAVPDAVRERFRAGAAGRVPETPAPGDPAFEAVHYHVAANAMTALRAAADRARRRGYEPLVLSSRVRGEAAEVAKGHVAVGEEVRATGTPVAPPAVVLSGGELTVTVTGDGDGGPNQEFALRAALELDGEDVALAAVDTDGRDGGTDAAGALVDAETVDDRDRALAALADNNACGYLDAVGALLHTGPTGTNVNDLRVLVVE